MLGEGRGVCVVHETFVCVRERARPQTKRLLCVGRVAHLFKECGLLAPGDVGGALPRQGALPSTAVPVAAAARRRTRRRTAAAPRRPAAAAPRTARTAAAAHRRRARRTAAACVALSFKASRRERERERERQTEEKGFEKALRRRAKKREDELVDFQYFRAKEESSRDDDGAPGGRAVALRTAAAFAALRTACAAACAAEGVPSAAREAAVQREARTAFGPGTGPRAARRTAAAGRRACEGAPF